MNNCKLIIEKIVQDELTFSFESMTGGNVRICSVNKAGEKKIEFVLRRDGSWWKPEFGHMSDNQKL